MSDHSSASVSELEFVSTEDILAELFKRYNLGCVFLGVRQRASDTRDRHQSFHGDPAEIVLLLESAKAHMLLCYEQRMMAAEE